MFDEKSQPYLDALAKRHSWLRWKYLHGGAFWTLNALSIVVSLYMAAVSDSHPDRVKVAAGVAALISFALAAARPGEKRQTFESASRKVDRAIRHYKANDPQMTELGLVLAVDEGEELIDKASIGKAPPTAVVPPTPAKTT